MPEKTITHDAHRPYKEHPFAHMDTSHASPSYLCSATGTYPWGHSMEQALREAIKSRDRARHGYSRITAHNACRDEYLDALQTDVARLMLMPTLMNR